MLIFPIHIDDFTNTKEAAEPSSSKSHNTPALATPDVTMSPVADAPTNRASSEPGNPSQSSPRVVRDASKTAGASGIPFGAGAPDVGAVVQVTTLPNTTNKLFLLKNKKDVVVATATKLEGDNIHGEPLKEGCCKVAITSVTIAGSKTWYPDQFGENILERGNIVQWPISHTTCSANVSPLTTRSKRKK